MAVKEMLDSRVSVAQCDKAVKALHEYALKAAEKEDETELLGAKEQHVWLNVTVKKIPAEHKLKPVKIPIVHPLIDPRASSICLLTKDPQREYKDLLEKNNIKFISRVIGVTKLKGKFHPYEARRMLLKENGMFLADERIIPILPKLLGAKWFQAKKQPIPVCLTRKDLKAELERAVNSTYMNQNRGTFTSVKIGTMTQTPAQILANLKSALPGIAKHIYGGWENIQSFSIKTSTSASLPIWNCSLDDGEGGRWEGLTADMDVDEEEAEKEKEVKSPKGKKRVAVEEDDDDEVEEAKPKKKSKGETKAVAPPTTKKAKTAVVAASPAPKAKAEKPKATAKVTTTTTVTTPSKSTTKKTAAVVASPAPAPAKKAAPTPTISATEIKSKRTGASGEKKKEKTVKAKTGKSAKDKMLGKKAATSQI